MTPAQVIELARTVRMRDGLYGPYNTEWRTNPADDMLMLVVKSAVPDAERSAKAKELWAVVHMAVWIRVSDVVAAGDAAEDVLVKFYVEAVLAALRHELQEQVRIGGRRAFRPHELPTGRGRTMTRERFDDICLELEDYIDGTSRRKLSVVLVSELLALGRIAFEGRE